MRYARSERGPLGPVPALLAAIAVVAGLPSACSTTEPAAPAADVAGIDATLDALYRSFCFDPGGQADWGLMRSLFAEGAAFVAPIKDGQGVRAMDADEFVESFREWIAGSPEGESGLHERIAHTRIDAFGNVAHAYVAFEGFVPGEPEAQTVGLDSIQLVRERGTWLVVSFATQYAGEDEPLPTRFLGR